MTAPLPPGNHDRLLALLDDQQEATGVVRFGTELEGEVPIGRLRRARRVPGSLPEGNVGTLTLVEQDGVLLWRTGSLAPQLAGRRGRGGDAVLDGAVVSQRRFLKLEPNKVGEFLAGWDDKLTPAQGLKRLTSKGLVPVVRPTGTKRILLIVHGTFSNAQAILDGIRETTDGKAFLAAAAKHYDEILAFDHPTLSVSPILNAVDLGRLFEGMGADVDVITHSRGGIVTRWFLESFAGGMTGTRRAVIVGAPLEGTSLAAPARMRAAMSLLTNIGNALAAAGSLAAAAPFVSAALAILKVATSVTRAFGRLPLFDAAMAMVPGLQGQSAISNNVELLRQRSVLPAAPPAYFVVKSNFEPDAPGWKFWRYFRKDTVLDAAADWLFDGPNDLVVDTASMDSFGPAGLVPRTVHDFGTSKTVMHTNYFSQPATIAYLRTSLGV